MFKFYFFFLISLMPLLAQTPTLLTDMTTATGPANPKVSSFRGTFSGSFYFNAYSNSSQAVFKCDGTDTNTIPVAAFFIGGSTNLASVMIMTSANTLWKTDGTSLGTSVLYDKAGFSIPTQLTKVGSKIFFLAITSAGKELWVTDGTTSGTHMVKDIYSGNSDSNCTYLTSFQGKLYFSAKNGVDGQELWMSDGTESGTTMVKNIATGAASSNPSELFVHNSTLFFSATTSAAGSELWKSDGTAANTTQVIDINPGQTGSNPREFSTLASTLYFACVDATHGLELWSSDGTEAGTHMVKDLAPGSDWGIQNELYVAGGNIYFSGTDGTNGYEPCISDGTSGGTKMLKDIETGSGWSFSKEFASLGSSVIFTASTSAQGMEWWITDGTTAGTHIVVDLITGPNSGILLVGPVFNNKRYFSAQDGNESLWATDGTAAGTLQVTNRTDSKGSDQSHFALNGSKFFFDMNTSTPGIRSLGVSDGTAAGTIPLHATGLKNPISMQAAGSDTFFLAGTSAISVGYELWKTDGTLAGTTLVRSHPQNIMQTITNLTTFQDNAYYVAVDEPSLAGFVIWKSDGTTAGTTVFTSLGSYNNLCVFNNKFIFYEGFGKDIFVSDGTSVGTSVADSAYVYGEFHEFNGKLIFSGNTNSTSEVELCSFDGVTATLIKDILPGNLDSSSPGSFTTVGSWLYFVAIGTNSVLQLWKTDGTSANTQRVMDLSSYNYALIGGFNNKLYFMQETALYGIELWVSDGTSAGTKLVSDVFPGSIGSGYSGSVFDHRLYLTLWHPVTGTELWTSDGTASGTEILSDLLPGPIGNKLDDITAIGKNLYFTAASSGENRELWTVPILPNAAILTNDTYLCFNTPGWTASVITAQGNATYSWSATNATIDSGANTSQITYTSGPFGNVELSVSVTDSAGTSQKSLLIPILNNIGSVGPISGPSEPCVGSQVTYSVIPNIDLDTYIWQVPLHSSIVSGQGTASIQVTVGSTAGEIIVEGHNSCSTTVDSTLSITPGNGIPAAPASISGPTQVCTFQAGVGFSTPLVQGATAYIWTVPTGASISQGQGTSSIQVNFSDSPGSITVKATNTCGESAIYSKSISVNSPPSSSAAGPDQNLQGGQIAQLNANQPSVGTGTWSVVQGPSSQVSQFSSLNSNTSTFTPQVSPGSYTLRWTISNGTCQASTDELILTYSAPQGVDLRLEVSCVNSNPSVGEVTSFNVILTNNGSIPATGIQVTLDPHPDVEIVAHGLTHGTYFPSTLRWEINSLASGSTATLTPQGFARTLGTKPIIAEVTQCNEPDVNSTPGNHDLLEDDMDQCTWQPAPYVYIPDPALKLLITSDPSMDTFDDDEISPLEASLIFGIDCSSQGVADLTGIETFINLQTLLATSNPITVLPGLQGLTSLSMVIMDDCALTHLNDPNGVFALPFSLDTLSLNRNNLTELPPELFLMSFLQFIFLDGNPLGMVPDSFDLLPDLKYLDLSRVGLSVVPDSIGFHATLEHLVLNNNGLLALPFVLPDTLRGIEIEGNRIQDITPLSFCPQLEIVILSKNEIEDLTPLTGIPGLLMQGAHFVLVDRNRISTCSEISDLTSRANLSGAYFEYNPQGTFSAFNPELPQWQTIPDRLLKWVNDVSAENYISNLSCP